LRKLAPWIVFVAIVAVHLPLLSVSIFGYIDDAFISFRYAENLANGHGLVYNVGQRVEGYSNTLLVLVLALLAKLGLTVHKAAAYVGVVFHAATVALALAYFRRVLSEPILRPFPMLGLVFLTVHPITIAYAEAGMEATMAAFWLLAAVYLTTIAVERGKAPLPAAGAALATFALALTRPEGISMAAPLGLWLLLGKREGRWGRAFVYGALTAALYGAFLLWRHSYFGYWQPNTYYAKAAGAGMDLIVMGLDYLWRFTNVTLLPYLLLPVLALLAAQRVRMPDWWFGVLGATLVYLAAIVWVGGDHFPLSRFLVPVAPLLLVLLAEGARRLRDAINAKHPNIAELRLRPAAWVSIALFIPVSIFFGMMFRNEGLIYAGQVKKAETWCSIGKKMAQAYDGDTSLGLIPIGAIGYCSKLPIVDLVGLTDAHIAHAETDLSRSMAGHGRYDSEYVLTQAKPKIVMGMVDIAPEPIPEWFVRRALYHQPIKDLVGRRQFIDDYAYHRMQWGSVYFHYWSRRDFEPLEQNPGEYPVPGIASRLPEREPLAGGTLWEKAFGKREAPEPEFEVPDDWEVW